MPPEVLPENEETPPWSEPVTAVLLDAANGTPGGTVRGREEETSNGSGDRASTDAPEDRTARATENTAQVENSLANQTLADVNVVKSWSITRLPPSLQPDAKMLDVLLGDGNGELNDLDFGSPEEFRVFQNNFANGRTDVFTNKMAELKSPVIGADGQPVMVTIDGSQRPLTQLELQHLQKGRTQNEIDTLLQQGPEAVGAQLPYIHRSAPVAVTVNGQNRLLTNGDVTLLDESGIVSRNDIDAVLQDRPEIIGNHVRDAYLWQAQRAAERYNQQLATSNTTDTADPNPNGTFTTIPVRTTEGSVLPNPATDAPVFTPNVAAPRSNQEVSFAAPTTQGYNPMNPPGIAEMHLGQQTQSNGGVLRGQQAAIQSNFDITNRSSTSDYGERGITYDYTGTIASGTDGRETGFHAKELVDTKGKITGRSTQYNQPVDMRFQTENGGSREIAGVTSIETTFNTSTGNYDSIIRTNSGETFNTTSDSTGKVKFEQPERSVRDMAFPNETLTVHTEGSGDARHVTEVTRDGKRVEGQFELVGEDGLKQNGVENQDVTRFTDGRTVRQFLGDTASNTGQLTINLDASGRITSATDAQNRPLEGELTLSSDNSRLIQKVNGTEIVHRADGATERTFQSGSSTYTVSTNPRGQVLEVRDQNNNVMPGQFELVGDNALKQTTEHGAITRFNDGSTERRFNGGADGRGNLTIKADADGKVTSVTDAQGKALEGQFELTSDSSLRRTTENMVVTLNADGSSERRFLNANSGQFTVRADSAGQVTEVLDKDGKVYAPTDTNGQPVKFELVGESGFKEISANQEITRLADGSSSRVVKGDKGPLFTISTNTQGKQTLQDHSAALSTGLYGANRIDMPALTAVMPLAGITTSMLVGELQTGPNGDLSFASNSILSPTDRVTIHSDGTVSTSVRNQDGTIVPIQEGMVDGRRQVISAAFPDGHPMEGTWTRNTSNPNTWTRGGEEPQQSFQGDITFDNRMTGAYTISKTDATTNHRTTDSFTRNGSRREQEFDANNVRVHSVDSNPDGSRIETTQLNEEGLRELQTQTNTDLSIANRRVDRVTITDANGTPSTVYQVTDTGGTDDTKDDKTHVAKVENSSGTWVRQGGPDSHNWTLFDEQGKPKVGADNQPVTFRGDFSYNANNGSQTRTIEGYGDPIVITTRRDGRLLVANGNEAASAGQRGENGDVTFTDAKGQTITLHGNGDRTTKVNNRESTSICELSEREGIGPDGKPYTKQLRVIGAVDDNGKTLDGNWVRQGGPDSRVWQQVDDKGNPVSENGQPVTFNGSFDLLNNGRLTITDDSTRIQTTIGRDGWTLSERRNEAGQTVRSL